MSIESVTAERTSPTGAAFEYFGTAAILADESFVIVRANPAFSALYDAHEEAFSETFGDESSPGRLAGQPLDLFLEGLGYRRALRKSPVMEAGLDVGDQRFTVRLASMALDGGGRGYLLEWQPERSSGRPQQQDISAIRRVVDRLAAATSAEEAARGALEAVREAFGWAYGSYWALDAAGGYLRFVVDSGRVNDEFHRVTATATFEEGVGLSGRAWRARELVFVEDLGAVADCCRRESAQRAGVTSGVCFPIMDGGKVVGTMDFFALERLRPSEERLDTLRVVGRLVSQAVARFRESERQLEVARQAAVFRTAVDNSSNPLMLVDERFVITYLNPASEAMLRAQEKTLRESLPSFSVDRLVGTCIDAFHKNPAHQRRMMGDERNLPHHTRVRIGGLTFDLVVNGMMDGEKVLGYVAEWRDVSDEVDAQAQIERMLAASTAGRLEERLDVTGWSGFTEVLGKGMNGLVDAVSAPLSEAKRVVKALARGDLTQEASADLQGEFAELANALNDSIVNLRMVIGQIVAAGAKIGQASGELNEGNAHLNGRTQQQAAALEETAATVEELTGTVRQNAENAQEANRLAAEARGLAERGGEVVGCAVSAMSEINRASKKISDIIGVIDEIAFQTNLLALNAAVEAARAGEQGRGFAVVAAEVRNLAQRSAGAAKEIKALIKDSVEKVEDGSRLVDSSGKTLRDIVEGVKRVSEIIAEIAAASEEQATGIEQVNKAVAQMDEMTQQNAAMVEQAAAASTAMNEQAHALRELVGRFELDEAASTGLDVETVRRVERPKPPVDLGKERRRPGPAAPAKTLAPSDWDEF